MKSTNKYDHPVPDSSHPISSNTKSNHVATDNLTLLPRIVSSSIGAVLTALAVQPLEVIKVRQQALSGASISSAPQVSSMISPPSVIRCLDCGTMVLDTASTATSNNGMMPRDVNKSIGTIRGISRHIFRSQGIVGFYAGLYPSLVMSVPNTAIYFSCYDEIVFRMKRRKRKIDDNEMQQKDYYDRLVTPFVAGAVARIFATVATSPFELIRTRQAGNIGAGSMASEFRSIIRASNTNPTANFSSLYKGLLPTLWRDVPFSCIYWLGVENFKDIFFQRGQGSPSSSSTTVYQSFVSGALSGVVAAACTTPFDVVKTRSQVTLTNPSSDSVKKATYHLQSFQCNHQGREILYPSDRNLFFQMRHIVETEGIASLWRGNISRMLKIGPACALMLSSYEYGKYIFLSG